MGLTKENTVRIEWLDVLKGFLMFCVTIGHGNMWAPIERYIYSFHMPLFFFISGFLFLPKQSTKEMLIKRSKRLLLPFLCWNGLSALIGFLSKRNVRNFIEELLVLKGNLTWNAPLWFLLVLFITEVMVIVCGLYKKTWISVTIITLCVILWVLFGNEWLLWKINLVPMAMFFFLLGYVLKGVSPFFQKWYLLILFGVGSVVFAMLNIRVVYTYGMFGNYAYCIASAVCGVLFWVGVFSKFQMLSRLSFLKTWGKNSLAIMALQFFVLSGIRIASLKIINLDLTSIENSAVTLVLALFTIGVIMLCVLLLKKGAQRQKWLSLLTNAFGIT